MQADLVFRSSVTKSRDSLEYIKGPDETADSQNDLNLRISHVSRTFFT